MGQQCDLNEIRRTLQESRQSGDLEPLQSSKQLVVHEGRIQTADDLDPGEERQAAQIHQATFASLSNWHPRELRLVNVRCRLMRDIIEPKVLLLREIFALNEG